MPFQQVLHCAKKDMAEPARRRQRDFFYDAVLIREGDAAPVSRRVNRQR
jgi:hypothetical protein